MHKFLLYSPLVVEQLLYVHVRSALQDWFQSVSTQACLWYAGASPSLYDVARSTGHGPERNTAYMYVTCHNSLAREGRGCCVGMRVLCVSLGVGAGVRLVSMNNCFHASC